METEENPVLVDGKLVSRSEHIARQKRLRVESKSGAHSGTWTQPEPYQYLRHPPTNDP